MTINPQKKDSSSSANLSQDNSSAKSIQVDPQNQKSSRIGTNKNNQADRQLELMQTQSSRRIPWWQAWQLWATVLVLVSGGIGYSATSLLLKLPKAQSCSKVFWPIASATIRLYCAQVEAEKRTVPDLLNAIALVEALSSEHPLRLEINRNVENWAQEILDIGEEKFQAGNLEAAIATAKQIPEDVEAYDLVDAKIQSWQSIWSEASENYQQVEKHLREADWNEAFLWAVRLTNSENQYWATTKYQETIDKINIAQEENATVDAAYTQFRRGGLDNLLAAIDKAEEIESDSYAYENAQKLMADAKDRILRYGENLINSQDWQELLQLSTRIPYSLKLQEKVQEWNILAGAGSSASLGTVYSLEEAIAEAKKLPPNSSYYPQAKQLIKRWQLEKEDVVHLSRAKELAVGGEIENLNQAIAAAGKIPATNPLYQEAQQEIANWRREIQIIQDQPILDRAQELAFGNSITDWRRAIAEANLISSDSPLYSEAQRYITTWRANIERQEDQPILDEAVSLASSGDYAAAIETAQKISSGRILYGEAQQKVSLWQLEIQGRDYLREAYAWADQGTPEALIQAIEVAQQISSSTSLYSRAVADINRWSSQILAIAEAISRSSIEQAIAIASKIPAGTDRYQQAQSLIQRWQEQLQPVIPESLRLNKKKSDDNSSSRFFPSSLR
jgi:hypothetical protein